ncbi:MAG: hypothetical protein ACC613_09605 [Synergistales bacterium]
MISSGHLPVTNADGVEEFLRRFERNGMMVIPTDTGRSALVLALRTLVRKGCSGTAWIPAYACPSLPPVFRNEGMRLHRYGTASDFRPIFPSPGPAKEDIVLVIHYFGFSNHRVLGWIRSIPPERRPFLIEDCAGSSLTESIGFDADFSFFSFRKFFEVADGAALVSRFPVQPELNPADSRLAEKRDNAFGFMRAGAFETGLCSLKDAEAELDRALPLLPRTPSFKSWEELKKVPFRSEALHRREAGRLLLESITASFSLNRRIQPLLSSIPDDAAPLVLPVAVRTNRDHLSALFWEKGLNCPSLWDLNPSLRFSFPSDYDLGRRTLGLPLPRREEMNELNVILDCLKIFSA